MARRAPGSTPDRTDAPLLDVRDLHVTFHTEEGDVRAVDGVSFDLAEDEVLAIVGESGSGKSVTMLSAMRLLAGTDVTVEGEARFRGQGLLSASTAQMRRVRGSDVAMIFQDPMSALNPVYTVGWQIAEQIREHEPLSAAATRGRVLELLRAVGISDPEQRARAYPHQLSGGMRQRVMIALALSCRPRVLIADEPTTALDVTIQAQIFELIAQLRAQTRCSVILITHDMGVVAEIADRVQVMYAGRVVEQGSTRDVFHDPMHPYTWGLLGSIPRLDLPRPRRLTAIPGQPASGASGQPGCPFAPRCPHRFDRCAETPLLTPKRSGGHLDACHLPLERRPELRKMSAPAVEAEA